MQTRKITHPLSLTFLFSGIGAVLAHIYLTQQHIVTKYLIGEGGSLCNISDYLNCGTAIASPYSEFLGVPLAVFGAVTNILMVGFAFKALVLDKPAKAGKSAGVALTLAALTVVASLVMAVISMGVLKTLCPFCTLTYVFSFVALFTGIALFKPLIAGSFPVKTVAVTLVSLVAVSWLSGTILTKKYKITDVLTLRIQKWQTDPAQDITLVSPLTYGPEMAKMRIVEFADFLCIHCKMAFPKLHSFAKSHPGVQIAFQSFPLDGCKGTDPAKPGTRCQLAMIAQCAGQQNKGWEAHGYIFENQEPLAHVDDIDNSIPDIAKAIGADAEKLKTCRQDPITLDTIKKQLELGKKLGVEGTPAFFINEKLFQGGAHLPALQEAYKTL